jgi:hypothetical protein
VAGLVAAVAAVVLLLGWLVVSVVSALAGLVS